jgi:hypothetical protein
MVKQNTFTHLRVLLVLTDRDITLGATALELTRLSLSLSSFSGSWSSPCGVVQVVSPLSEVGVMLPVLLLLCMLRSRQLIPLPVIMSE